MIALVNTCRGICQTVQHAYYIAVMMNSFMTFGLAFGLDFMILASAF